VSADEESVCFIDSDGPLAEVVDANVYVGYDQPAEISCMLRANPTPKVMWIHNDTPINPLDNANVFASQHTTIYLLLYSF